MHITAHTYDHKPVKFPGLIERRYIITIFSDNHATFYHCTPSQYDRIYKWLVRRGAKLNPFNLPDYNVLVYGGARSL